ncbi:hypothetical protein EVAR_64088_1 [Eumeta japonica]|uniref:Uncharacterized protein n=1 Tax=Eumeta variegata TaxID=151549 RepID=A0A4C1ZJ79_EUMVA|nr:hypothetical protein EVAR_64088_1 [Eumeta japonica]
MRERRDHRRGDGAAGAAAHKKGRLAARIQWRHHTSVRQEADVVQSRWLYIPPKGQALVLGARSWRPSPRPPHIPGRAACGVRRAAAETPRAPEMSFRYPPAPAPAHGCDRARFVQINLFLNATRAYVMALSRRPRLTEPVQPTEKCLVKSLDDPLNVTIQKMYLYFNIS